MREIVAAKTLNLFAPLLAKPRIIAKGRAEATIFFLWPSSGATAISKFLVG